MKKVICENCTSILQVTNKTDNFRCPNCRHTTITVKGNKIHEGCYIHPKTEETETPVTCIKGQPLKKIKRLIKPYEITVEVISRYSHFEIYNDDVIVNFIYHKFTPIDDFVFELICKMHDLNHPEKKPCIVPNYQLYGVRYENC